MTPRDPREPSTALRFVEDFMAWLFRDGGLEPPRRAYDDVAERLENGIADLLRSSASPAIRDETPDGLRAALKDIAAVALEGHREHGYRRPAGEFFKTIIDLAEAALSRSTGPGDTDGGLDA